MDSRVLIIRFSSIGDVVQALSLPSVIQYRFMKAEIHWLVHEDFAPLIEHHPSVCKVWKLPRSSSSGDSGSRGSRSSISSSISGLLDICRQLDAQNFTHIYDAHNSLRSNLVTWLVRAPHYAQKPRPWFKRWLLFKFGKNLFKQPFSGQRDLIEPLAAWGIPFSLPPVPQMFIPNETLNKVSRLLALEFGQASDSEAADGAAPDTNRPDELEATDYTTMDSTTTDSTTTQNKLNFVALGPSAAYELKRWPLEYWQKLIESFPQTKFVLLGGIQDTFLKELATTKNVHNFGGALSLLESAAVVKMAKVLVVNDTGLLHFAEQLGTKAIALMGPAPFGFPSRESTTILQIHLPCRPCSKHGQGPCRNPERHKCMRDILPTAVAEKLNDILGGP